ncbi:hypothetical protein [Spirosoma aerolatum]|nr:hypothetical protein [Spirosoma aerolatum]
MITQYIGLEGLFGLAVGLAVVVRRYMTRVFKDEPNPQSELFHPWNGQ